MAQAKGDGPEPSYKPVDAYAGTDPPEWNDLLRGILVALVEKNTLLHQINLQISKQDKSAQIRSTKEKVMEVFANQIATVLQNQDPRMNAWAVLEKWCWMMEMYSRAVEFKFNWRYVNSMNFLVNSPSSVYNVYIGSLNPERFVELTHKYATTPEEHAATQLVPSKKSRRFSSGTGLFSPEMSLYMEITKKDAAQSIVVVSTPESMPPVQLVPSTASSGFLLQGNTPMTAESPVRGRRGRAAAKYSTRTRVQQAANLDSLPTSVADILNALSAVSSTTSAPTPPKPDNLKAVSVKEEPVEQKVHEPLEWSKELTVGLIEGIKLRPELWSLDMEAPQDKNQLKDIVEGLRTIPGGRSLTVPLTISAWKMLSNFIRVPNSKLAVDFHLSPDELRSRLQFLVEKDAKASFEATMGQLMANGINGHEMQVHLQQMLGLLPQPQEISPRENQPSTQKRPRLASPSMRDPKKNCPSPQVVTTWVPPKEEAYKSPFVAVTAPTSNPTATAQILSTSSGIPLPTLFSQSVDHSTKEPKPERKTQVNGLGKRNSTHLDGGVKEDKWTTMEHTCRELETKDPETAIQLQRELSEVLYRSQLQSLKRTFSPVFSPAYNPLIFVQADLYLRAVGSSSEMVVQQLPNFGSLSLNGNGLNKLRGINETMLHLYSTAPMLSYKIAKRQELEKLITEECGGGTLKFYGSCKNGFGSKDSDYDMSFKLKLVLTDRKSEKENPLKILSQVCKVILKRDPACQAEFISTAKVPIVTSPLWRGVEIDISYDNFAAIENTDLLQTYCKWAPDILPQLGFWVKKWAKANKICGDPFFKSYHWCILTIYYLQRVGWKTLKKYTLNRNRVVPYIQREFLPPNTPAPWKHYETKVVSGWSNDRGTLAEHFLGFLEFYSTFAFAYEVIQIITPMRWTRKKNEYAHPVCIRDPFFQGQAARRRLNRQEKKTYAKIIGAKNNQNIVATISQDSLNHMLKILRRSAQDMRTFAREGELKDLVLMELFNIQ